jgi:hypothetical protein
VTITSADVAAWLGTPFDTGETVLCDRVVAAVESRAAELYDLDTPARDDECDLALILQAARIYRRRYTPDARSGDTDTGPVFVAQFDHDVDQMLIRRRRLGFV